MTSSLAADFSASQADAVTPASSDPSVVPATTIAPPENLSNSRLKALGFLGGACLLFAAPVVYMGSSATADFRAAAGVLTSNVETVFRAAQEVVAAQFPREFPPMTVVNLATGSLTPRSEVEFLRLLAEISKGRCRGGVEFIGHVPYTSEGARVNDIRISMALARKLAERVRGATGVQENEIRSTGFGSQRPLIGFQPWNEANLRVEARCLGISG